MQTMPTGIPLVAGLLHHIRIYCHSQVCTLFSTASYTYFYNLRARRLLWCSIQSNYRSGVRFVI